LILQVPLTVNLISRLSVTKLITLIRAFLLGPAGLQRSSQTAGTKVFRGFRNHSRFSTPARLRTHDSAGPRRAGHVGSSYDNNHTMNTISSPGRGSSAATPKNRDRLLQAAQRR